MSDVQKTEEPDAGGTTLADVLKAVQDMRDDTAAQIGALTAKVQELEAGAKPAEAAPQGAEKSDGDGVPDQDSGAEGTAPAASDVTVVGPGEAGKTYADFIDALKTTTNAMTALTSRLDGPTKGSPQKGGPTSTAAEEEATKTDEGSASDPFGRIADDVRAGAGTPAAAVARRQAAGLVAGAVLLGLGAEPVDKGR